VPRPFVAASGPLAIGSDRKRAACGYENLRPPRTM